MLNIQINENTLLKAIFLKIDAFNLNHNLAFLRITKMLNQNYDLFGQVIITHQDIKNYLDTLPRFLTNRQKSTIEHYINEYEITNKLIKLKLDGSLEKLINQLNNEREYRDNSLNDLDAFKPKYKENWKRKPCPPHHHICGFMDCPVFLKKHKSAINRKYYLNKKLKKEKAAKAAKKAILKNTQLTA